MKKIITDGVAAIVMAGVALAPLSSAWAADQSVQSQPRQPRVSIIDIAQRLIPPDELQKTDTKFLAQIAPQGMTEEKPAPMNFREWSAYKVAAWLVRNNNILAAREVLAETRSDNQSIVSVINALDVAYSPVGDEDEEDDLAGELSDAVKKKNDYYAAAGKLLEYPGAKLFLDSAVYDEKISAMIATTMLRASIRNDVEYGQVMAKLKNITTETTRKPKI